MNQTVDGAEGYPLEVPPEAQEQLLERAQARLEERIRTINDLAEELRRRANRYGKLSRRLKFAVIILGALLTTRVVIDTILGGDTPPGSILLPITKYIIPIIFSLMSATVAIIGGIDQSFKPGESAREVMVLRTNCEAVVLEVEELWARTVERLGVSMEALRNTDELLTRLSNHIKETQRRMAQLGVDVPQSSGGSS